MAGTNFLGCEIRIKHKGVEGWLDAVTLIADELDSAKDYTDEQIAISSETYINVKSALFGAKGDGVANDQPAIQAAINYAITNSIKTVFFPVGHYLIGAPLILARIVGGVYTTFNLELVGAVNANAPILGQSTRITATYKDTFAIGIQTSRSVTIKNLYIAGQYNYTKSTKQLFEEDITTWGADGVRDETNSPYGGIVIDPFGTSVPPDGGYPGLTEYYKASAGGSACVNIEFCYITNFVVGLLCTAYNTPQAEEIFLHNTKIYVTKVAAAYGQPQTRACVIRDCFFFSCFNGIDTTSYGEQIGASPHIDGLIISKVKNIISVDTGRGIFNAKRIEAEAFWRIGVATGTEGSAFYSCIFKFYYGKSDSDWAKAPDTLVFGSSVTFYNCAFNKAGDVLWNANFNGCDVSFEHCYFDTQYVPYHSRQNGQRASFKETRINNLLVSEGINRYHSTTEVISAYNGSILHKSSDSVPTAIVHKPTPTENGNSVFLEEVTLTVDAGGDSSATFDLTSVAKIRVGDMIFDITPPRFYFLNRFGLYSDTGNPIASPFIGTVESIDGLTVTLKDVPFYVTSGTYQLSAKWSSIYTGGILGTFNSGSPIITNVYQENSGVNYAGMRLRLKDPSLAIPYGAYVVSEDKGARTMTLSANCINSITSSFIYTSYYDKDIRVSTAPGSATGLYVEKGDVIDRIDSSLKYVCSSPGIVGNVTHAPAFLTLTPS